MPGALLRSGKLKDFKALGEDGQPVYASALQLREAIRLKLGRDAAQCLAVPQRNETGDIIDWYAPEPGDVVPWSSATDEERADAKNQLETIHAKLSKASQTPNSKASREQQIFTRLLKKVIHFPDDTHVYLVEGKPVLTFWGFIDPQASADADPISRLRMREKATVVSEPVAAPLITPVVKKRFPWWWLLLLALLLLLLFWLLHSCAPETIVPPLPLEHAEDPVSPVVPGEHWNHPVDTIDRNGVNTLGNANGLPPETGVPQEDPAIDTPETADPEQTPEETPSETPDEPQNQEPQDQEPEAPAEDTAQPPEQPEVEPGKQPGKQPEEPPAQEPSQPPNTPLNIPSEAAKNGSTDFLNGDWKAGGGIQDARTGKPMKMEYNFKDGKGQVKVSGSGGRECVGDVSANMTAGGLSINNKGQAKCNDGTTYSLPDVKCKAGATSAADCSGSYDADTQFPISMKKS